MNRREFVRNSAMMTALLPAGSIAAEGVPESRSSGVSVQRLSWAGIKLVFGQSSVFVDPWVTSTIWEGAWTQPVVPIEASTEKRYVLLTHLHNDHFDPAAIRAVGEDIRVLCPKERASVLASRSFRTLVVGNYEPGELGDFCVTPVPASDGVNETQVSWVIAGGGKKMIHCGDTLWHGGFWQIGQQHGPFDVAFLPINGAKFLFRKPFSDVEATMTPAQAVGAAVVLQARLVVPIHYGVNNPKSYLEHPGAESEFLEHARKRSVQTKIMAPAETMTL